MARPWHPNKDLERALRECERRGWRVTKNPRGYFKLWCPCPAQHRRSVHLTPSGPRYTINLRKWLQRCSCWDGEDPR